MESRIDIDGDSVDEAQQIRCDCDADKTMSHVYDDVSDYRSRDPDTVVLVVV